MTGNETKIGSKVSSKGKKSRRKCQSCLLQYQVWLEDNYPGISLPLYHRKTRSSNHPLFHDWHGSSPVTTATVMCCRILPVFVIVHIALPGYLCEPGHILSQILVSWLASLPLRTHIVAIFSAHVCYSTCTHVATPNPS